MNLPAGRQVQDDDIINSINIIAARKNTEEHTCHYLL